MRIVAGAWRGRTLVAPPGQETRPTADRVRQALFDMLMHAEWGGREAIEGAVVLDVFAGSGALGLEALSRGAARACFIESDEAALRALRANVVACGAGDRTEIVAGDALLVARLLDAPFSGHERARADGRGKPIGQQDNVVRGSRSGRTCPGHPRMAVRKTAKSWIAGTCPAMTQSAQSGRTNPSMQAASRPFEDWSGDDGNKAGASASLVFFDPPYGQNLIPRALSRLREFGRIRASALIVAETGREETWVPDAPLLAERQHGAARILVFRVP